MRIFSSKSEKEVAKERALQRLNWPLRELAANLMRITRGAGRPEYLVDHMNAVAEALTEYRAAADCWPSNDEYRSILNLDVCAKEEVLNAWTELGNLCAGRKLGVVRRQPRALPPRALCGA
jgi:hypothetical protein